MELSVPSTMVSSTSPVASLEGPTHAFRFFDLPSELRRKIMAMASVVDRAIDLDFKSHRHTVLFLVSKQFHDEAAATFYGQNTFYLLPIHGRANAVKAQPLIAHLSPRYRAKLVHLRLRLGPFWTKPPKCWRITDSLGLEDATSVRVLSIFIEIDPSHAIFNGFRIAKGFYTGFCGEILKEVIRRLPNVVEINFDGNASVSTTGPLMSRLVEEARVGGKRVSWGPGKRADKIADSASYYNLTASQGMVPFYSALPLSMSGLKIS